MSSIVTELAELLSNIRRPGDFVTSGTTELLTPSLAVDGVGPIALPLLPFQAAQLVAAAERAPYGRGPDTIVDTAVRNTWQVAAEKVRIGGRHWPRTLAAILAHVAEGLGVSDPIEAEFYKLLIYDQGSFFVSHRDTEKSPWMFATLVIVLPSSSTGGELVVRHKDRSERLDLRVGDPSEVAFAAFYADCLHEVLPVTSGCRLTLVYNLIRRGNGSAPQPPNYDGQQGQLAALLRDWRAEMDRERGDDDTESVPDKLVYPLEHAYTAPELGFAVLKGADAAAAGVLAAAARQADCALHLALVTLEEFGSAEYAGDGGGRRRSRDHDDDEYEVGEIGDWSIDLSDWRALDGNPVPWGEIPVSENELSPPDPFHDLEPDELHFEEASGNAGVSFERRYRRAALVLWPNDRSFAVLTQAGLGVTVPHLSDLAQRAGTDRASSAWQQAHELAGHMIGRWPDHGGWSPDTTDSDAAKMLAAFTRLGDTAHIETFVQQVFGAGRGYAKRDNPALVAALALLPPGQAVDLIQRIVTANGAKRFGACADLLRRVPGTISLLRPLDLWKAAATLLDLMPSGTSAPERDWSNRSDQADAGFVADLVIALEAIERGLADRAVSQILASPKAFDIDAVLVPAARDGLRMPGVAEQRAVVALRAACLTHVRARIAMPLAPPQDWMRPDAVGCHCARCSQLSQFLADPKQKTWVFRAVESDRSHVESTIKTALCDVDTRTETRGRPYSLICTKNQASYERRARQRRQDLADEASLTKAG
jgi:predicted 2-oxoglutarate/Fe(II)-dependent dioxygenase YbiX